MGILCDQFCFVYYWIEARHRIVRVETNNQQKSQFVDIVSLCTKKGHLYKTVKTHQVEYWMCS